MIAGRGRRASPAVLRVASVTGHAGWCHAELGVLGGYWPAASQGRRMDECLTVVRQLLAGKR
jgi:hypothetical protein